MKISQTGLDLIKKYEGFSETAYICPAGVKTIGYGHTGSHVNDGEITEDQALKILDEDCDEAEAAVNSLVKVALNQNQFDAIVSFVFNVGTNSFKKSTMLKMINDRHFVGASEEFKRWVYADKVKLEGLVNRRRSEAALFLRKEKAH